ncbi:hypothetical protein LSAT2_012366 [Lamellibrachia satsuma]|nr:hypothetical protein LSAT2_012366 [Lamellibrachia satsuma]
MRCKGQNATELTEGIQRKSYFEVVTEGCQVVDARDVDEWLHRAVSWQENKDMECLVDQQHTLTELVAFLQQLQVEFTQLGSVEDVLQTLPQIGQLLGRLCSLPLLLTNETCYKVLMQCVLFFFVSQPRSAIETRAKQWALGQLRSSVCYSQQEFSSATLDVTGVTQHAFNEQCLQEVAAQLASQLELSGPSQQWPDHVTEQDSNCPLEEVCRICLHLRHIAEFSDLLDSVMLHMWRRACRKSEWETCLTELMQTQSSAYLDDSLLPLPYMAQRLLWQLKLESLEQEVLLLMEAVGRRSFLSKRPVLQLVKSRHLVKACMEHFDIYEAVFAMLKQLYQDSHGANTVVFVIGCLHECVRAEFGSSKCDSPPGLLPHYDSHLQSLVTVLLVDPHDLHTNTVEWQVRQISQLLQDLHQNSVGEIHFILLQFQTWYHVVLFLALTGTESVSKSCIDIVTTFKCCSARLPLEELQNLQLCLRETVFSLRGLFNKSFLQSDDLTCAIATSQNYCCNVMTDLISQLLMFFLVFSSGGHLLYKTILRMATGESDDTGHLDCMMDTLQAITSNLPAWLVRAHIDISRIRKIVDLLFSDDGATAAVCGPETESLRSAPDHCSHSHRERISEPTASDQNFKPIVVYREQWKNLATYLEQIT